MLSARWRRKCKAGVRPWTRARTSSSLQTETTRPLTGWPRLGGPRAARWRPSARTRSRARLRPRHPTPAHRPRVPTLRNGWQTPAPPGPRSHLAVAAARCDQLQRKHRRAPGHVITERGGDLRGIGRATGPSQQRDLLHLQHGSGVPAKLPHQGGRKCGHPPRVVDGLPHAEVAHDREGVQRILPVDRVFRIEHRACIVGVTALGGHCHRIMDITGSRELTGVSLGSR